MNNKIVISVNSAWNIYNFRAGLIKALIVEGYEVTIVAPDDGYSDKVEALGCRFVNLPIDTNGTNPLLDLLLLGRYLAVLRQIRPAAFLGYTVKPNIYGSVAAGMLRIPVINNIAGLGSTFINNNFVTTIVRLLYRFALRRSHHIFFQNKDDLQLFLASGIVSARRVGLLPGSGVDLKKFVPVEAAPLKDRAFRFLLVARLLKDKGVEEFAGAARLLKEKYPTVECQLLGFLNPANANSISVEQLRDWETQGIVSYLGKTDDVRPFISNADCIVLPSYREGVPRSLLEAAALARPIVATDVAGCRDAVTDGVNGFLCRPRDPSDLERKMSQVLELDDESRRLMGAEGRRKVEEEFDEGLVIQRYLHALRTVGVAAPANMGTDVGGLVEEPEYIADAG